MEQPRIHPTAVIDPAAELDSSVEVGPYAVIGPRVRIGAGCKVGAHVVLEGPTTLGENNRLYPFCSVGAAPQDKKYAGEDTALEIGNGNTIRECVTINRGTVQDGGTTRVGDDNWIMAYVHIAHDCVVGNHTIFANTTNLAGHVHIGDWVILGGNSQVHQFCKIGAHAMTGTGSIVLQDIPPYVMASGNPLATHGINSEGLRRRGFTPEEITLIRRAYKTLYRQGLTLAEARESGNFGAINKLEKDLAFHLGGHINHSTFWKNMSPEGGGRPDGELAAAIDEYFGGFDGFQKQFNAAANGIQGSGWSMLVFDTLGRRLNINQLYDQQGNLPAGQIPLLQLDMWEHAFYLQYKNVKGDYVNAWWNVVNWPDVAERFTKAQTFAS